MTQVDEKGHEGKTDVVTAYLRWRKHGQRNTWTGDPADYYQGIIYLVHYIILVQYSNPAEYFTQVFTLNIVILVQLWVAGEGLEW